jgi:hypothetical protein
VTSPTATETRNEPTMNISYDLDRAKQAVQFLASSSYFSKHLTKLRTALRRPRALPFKGDTEFLNELLVIGRQSASAFENLVHVAETKREDRNDYQRKFMADKRRRDRKVLELEALLTGVEVSFDERLRVLQRQYQVWNRQKQAMLSECAAMTWAGRNEQVRTFWLAKEDELDELLEEARKGPVRRATVYYVAPKTVVGNALAKAAGGRPIMAGNKAVHVVDKPSR